MVREGLVRSVDGKDVPVQADTLGGGGQITSIVTESPTAAPMRNTEPGMGASSEPWATAASGSPKRGSATR